MSGGCFEFLMVGGVVLALILGMGRGSSVCLAADARDPKPAKPAPEKSLNLLERLVAPGAAAAGATFDTFTKLLAAADLAADLKSPKPIMLLAPTDAAFAALPAGQIDKWLKPDGKEKLREVLAYHLIPERVAMSPRSATMAVTLNGKRIAVGGQNERNQMQAGDAAIVAELKATNGWIYVIDKVQIP